MGRGPRIAVAALLAFSLASSLVAADDHGGRLLVNEERLEQNKPSVVHAVVDLPPSWVLGVVEVHIEVQGPGTNEELVERRTGVEGGGTELVTVPWTPSQAGNHTLNAEVLLGDERRVIEERTVFVEPPSTSRDASAGVIPHTAPGTVQWAIAFGVLFFVTRASLERW